jgi:hypothetical protein
VKEPPGSPAELLTWAFAVEETMRIGRAIIIPAILALGVAGTVLPGAEIAMAAGHAPAVHLQTTAHPMITGTYYHG